MPTAKLPTLTVKNLKTLRACGPEGGAFTCTLYVDGKRAANVSYSGWGEAYRYDWIDTKLRPVAMRYVNALAPFESFDVMLTPDLDTVVGVLTDTLESDRRFTRDAKHCWIFRMPSDKDGEWRKVPMPRRLHALPMQEQIDTFYRLLKQEGHPREGVVLFNETRTVGHTLTLKQEA